MSQQVDPGVEDGAIVADNEVLDERRLVGNDQLVVRSAKRAELVAKQIVDLIFDRGLVPGTKLPAERLMLEQYGVSRGTLREALRILEVHGLLIIRPGPQGGPEVTAMTAAAFNKACSLHFKAASVTVEKLWQARVQIEPILAKLAAQQLSDDDRVQFEAILADSESGQLTRDGKDPSSEFHRLIASASGNPIMSLFGRSLGEMTAYLAGPAFPPSKRQAITRDHIAIGDAILSGDADKAEVLAASHMREMSAAFAERFSGILDDILPYII